MCVVWITVTRNKLYWCHGYLLVQHADCRPDTKCRLGTKCCLQTAEWVQMQTENLKSFLSGMVISCHLATYQASCNRFSAIAFLQSAFTIICIIVEYSWPFFFMKIDRNIISNLYRVFSLCTRVGCCDVSTDFTNIIKVDVDVNEMSLLNI